MHLTADVAQPNGNATKSALLGIKSLEFIAFTVGKDEYGIYPESAENSRLRTWDVDPIAPEFVKRVLNLRGIVAPIVDMRIKFNLGTLLYDRFTVPITLNIGGCVMTLLVVGRIYTRN